MKLSRIEERLLAAMAAMDIIDCHEHLPPEAQRTSVPQDVFTLFSHYTRHDLFSAGMDRDAYHGEDPTGAVRPVYQSLFNPDIPLARRWRIFRPYWRSIRYGSYAQAALVAAKMVYGVDDINDDTFELLSERIAAENTPGIYSRILGERCNIRAALTQCGSTAVARPLVPLMPLASLTNTHGRDQLGTLAAELGEEPATTLDEHLDVVTRMLRTWIGQGAVGIKTMSTRVPLPDKTKAEDAFKRLAQATVDEASREDSRTLSAFILHSVLDLAGSLDLTVAVHAGIWGDFRTIDAKFMLELAPLHPRTNFDLYHLGMPSVRDAIVVSKNLPNVYLNLCWTHIISQVQTCSGVDELIDHVPVNKVLAFGGDYARPVEKVVGHLHMARQDFAHVFGRRVERGLMSFDSAMHVLKLWFWDNPLRLYTHLDVEA